MDKNDFDLMRHKVETPSTKPQEVMLDIINTLERIWNRLTITPVDTTRHDKHGRVDLKE